MERLTDNGAQAQLAGTSQDRCGEIFRDAGDAMLLVDKVVLDCNPAASKLFHAHPAELVGRSFQDLHAWQKTDDSRVAAQEFERRAAAGETLRYEWKFQRSDGAGLDAAVSLCRIGDARSNCRLMILRELSESHECARTTGLLAERTAQLESVTSELDAFCYSVSHDLRAAIRGISACSQIVIDDFGDSLSEEARRWLSHIHNDSQQLDGFTEALLELSRVSRAPLNPVDIDLTSMAREIARELATDARERTVQFQSGEGLTACGDAVLVRTLLRNLLENAWKFTRKTPDARIEFGSLPLDSDSKPYYYVRDNGAGFDMAHADRLFVAFQRLHRDPDFPGSGVGLATVRRIAHRHAGKAWADGKPGVGATFCFTLPSSHRQGWFK